MPTKIFVGNVAVNTARESMLQLFQRYGCVTECDVLGNYAFVVSICILMLMFHLPCPAIHSFLSSFPTHMLLFPSLFLLLSPIFIHFFPFLSFPFLLLFLLSQGVCSGHMRFNFWETTDNISETV